ncbi:hypothetical protein [Cohnella fermenti]|nr:hypothetical protein [Cohnella fermenti]
MRDRRIGGSEEAGEWKEWGSGADCAEKKPVRKKAGGSLDSGAVFFYS